VRKAASRPITHSTWAKPPAGEGDAEDLVFRPEARQRRDTGDGQGGDSHGGGSDGHLLAQAAHLAHVLFLVHAVDHRTRAQEQQRLEEGVGHEMEDGGDVAPEPGGQEHEAELGHRRVGEHLLDVGLGDGDRRRPQGGDGTDGGDGHAGGGRLRRWRPNGPPRRRRR
jgi:hypothetical protein